MSNLSQNEDISSFTNSLPRSLWRISIFPNNSSHCSQTALVTVSAFLSLMKVALINLENESTMYKIYFGEVGYLVFTFKSTVTSSLKSLALGKAIFGLGTLFLCKLQASQFSKSSMCFSTSSVSLPESLIISLTLLGLICPK